ncbi:membrane protein [Cellvibrio zantedeschiae]|uniref:Membrane protein n=1 Tax=Cellvibrio zantedeschiae TaxID=1237077 RepID=A0ABQ3ASX5_9GAMM|nr:MAPEG family protein [Cellvibrio zantedeschiae]GGY64985.1 membrane protein [Cellvibrio zantedeschiae]
MIYAMFAMILLTFGVAGYMFKLRVAAVRSGEVKLSAFRLNSGENMPPKMLQAARNYSNLFEIPVFFYAAGTIYIALSLESPAIILLSWLFVATRILHSWIHITNNNVIRRMQAFMAGNVCILLIWALLVWDYSHRL